jgi:hypothetical protein
MNSSAELLIGLSVCMAAALAAFAVYKWQELRRVHLVESWVRDYLSVRFGDIPNGLRINCSNDRLWPVLARFDGPRVGVRHNLQFICPGAHSTFALLSESEEKL